jgi:hypothetical protein
MLETEIKKLTAAVEANTAAILGGSRAAATASETAPTAAPVTTAAPAAADPLAGLGGAAPAPATAEVSPAPVAVTLKQITEGIVALCKAKGREAAAMLMAEYGAQKVPDLKKDADKYPEILGKINALIEAK